MNKTMQSRVLLLLIIIVTVRNSDERKFTEHRAAEDESVIEKLEKQHTAEKNCLKRIDVSLSSKWSTEVKKIPTNDLGKIKSELVFVEPSKPIYHTRLQEWLMEKSKPSRRIETCFEKLKDNIDVQCLNNLLSSRISREKKFDKDFTKLLNQSSREELPFKKFISFHEFTELMFQNRNPDSMTGQERGVYEHSESQLSTEDDKDKKLFILQQQCEWKNAKKLKEASSLTAQFKEFESQVYDALNKRIGYHLLREEPRVNLTLIHARHKKWLKINEGIGKRLKREITELRTQKKSSQWLCEYATTLADQFIVEQKPILTENVDNYNILNLKISEIAGNTRAIEKVLRRRNDVRRSAMNLLAKNIENDFQCLDAFSNLVRQHHLFETASIFMNSVYTYPELHCNLQQFNLETISPVVCNCKGSFCAAYGLAVLVKKDYKMVRGNDGVYKIVLHRKN